MPAPPTVARLDKRTLGIVATAPQVADFGPDVIGRIKSAGATSTSLSVNWDEIETAPGVYQPNPNWLAIGEQFYPPNGLALTLAFAVIDTNNRRLPTDLASRSFDDPLVIARFRAMLDWARTQIPRVDIRSLVIGNEVDVYLAANPGQWPAWRAFLQAAKAHARSLWPAPPIGCKATFNGLANEPTRGELIAMNALCDELLVTWYPIGANFGVLPMSAVDTSFDTLVALPGKLPIRLLELGAPSDALIGGSQTLQADFVSACFNAWDRHAARIPHVEWFALHDFAPAQLVALQQYYGIVDARFAAYLGSLGLRSFAGPGEDKAAWTRLRAEMAARSG